LAGHLRSEMHGERDSLFIGDRREAEASDWMSVVDPTTGGADGPFGPEGLASLLGYTTIKVSEEVERAHQ